MSNKVNSSNLTTVVTVQSPGPRGPQGLKGLPGNITGSVTDIHAGGDITASGNISASGTIIANNFQSSGGNVDGISFTDDLNITGDITASGNISASGNLFAHSGSFMYITASKLEVDDSTIVIGGAEFTSASIRDIDKGTLNSRRDGTVRPGFLDSSQIRALTGGTILDTDTFIRLSVADEVRIDAGGVQYWNSDQDNATFTIGDDSTTYPLIIQTPTTMSRDLKVSGSLLVVTNITASNISASGTVLANKFQSTGGDVGGISFVDDLNITGDITASGNISSSGNILTSGNITALGTITAEQITSTDDMTAAGNLGVAGQINLATDIVHTLDPDTKIAFETDKITLAAGGVNMITLTEAATDQIEFANARTKFAGHITASGNISASGTVFASKFESAGASSETIAFNDNLNVTGNITASGNISASGDIIATEITGSSGLFTGTLRVDSGVNFNHTLGVDGTTIFEGDVQAAQNIMHLNDTDTKMEFGTDKITFTAGNKTFLILDGNTLPNAVSIGQTGCFTRISGSGLEVDTPITASGNISASGIITAEGLVISDDFSLTDDLTVGGNISASGTAHTIGGFTMGLADGEIVRNLTMGGTIIHTGDTDTKIAFTDDTITLSTGGSTTTIQEGHITASGNISGSSTSKLNLGGAINTLSHITASGNISASGYVWANYLVTGTDIFISDAIKHRGDTDTKIAFTDEKIESTADSISFVGNITASGHISSSGTITAAAAVLTTADINGGTIDGITSLTAGGNLDIGAHGFRANNLTADARTNGRVAIYGTNGLLQESIDLSFSGDRLSAAQISSTHITASGNITGSTIQGETLTANVFLSSPSASLTNITTTNITASGNISASGTIFASKFESAGTSNETISFNDNLNITGHITASGNISSSGTIQSTGNISTVGSITATSADINGDVDIDGGSLTVGTSLQLSSGGSFNFGSGFAFGRITWDADYASLFGLANKKLKLGSFNTQGVLTISSSTENTMVISASNVGIGTTTPGEALEVVGNISASGDVKGLTLTTPGTISGSIIEGQTLTADVFLSAPSASLTNITTTNITASGNISGSATSTINVGGNITTLSTGSFGEINLDDNKRIKIGTGDDLQIYHNGGNSYIQDTGTGKLILDTNGTEVRISKTDSEIMANFITDGAVELYHNHVKKFETTALGIDVTGNINASSHITASGNISGSATSTFSVGTGSILNKLTVGSITSSGVITAEGLVISDDALISDNLEVQGNISGSLTSTLSAGTGSLKNSITVGTGTYGQSTKIIGASIKDFTSLSGSRTSTLSTGHITAIGGVTSTNITASGHISASSGIQAGTVSITATDDGSGNGTIPNGTSFAIVDADSDADHIVVLPKPTAGNIVHLSENGTTGYELRSSAPASIAINSGTSTNGESAIAGAITYVKCVCVSATSWICSQYDADGDESKVEVAGD